MTSANQFLGSGRYWKQSSANQKITGTNNTTSFVDVVNLVGETLVSRASISVSPSNPVTVVEAQMVRDGDIITQQLTGSTSAQRTFDLVGFFGEYNSTSSSAMIQGVPAYARNDFIFRVRYVSGTSQNAIGSVEYSLGEMASI